MAKAKKKSSVSPTQRSLKLCRKAGWVAQSVERWNPFARVRQDLHGFVDIHCLTGTQIVGIQATSRDNVSSRLHKIEAEPRAKMWLQSGARLLIHGWAKMASGKFECREIEVTLAMLESAPKLTDGSDIEV